MTARRRAIVTGAAVLAAAVAVPALAAPAHRTSAENRQVAARDASQLLARVLLPAGAKHYATNPWAKRHLLGGHGLAQDGTKVVNAHTWWKIHEPFEDVVDSVQTHVPNGSRLEMRQFGGPPPQFELIVFSFPTRPGVLGYRWLEVSMVQLPHDVTGVRVDGEVQWIIPRPRSEKVPGAVKTIGIVRRVPRQPPTISRTVTNQDSVGRIIELVNRLLTVQPGVSSCGVWTGPIVTFRFMGAGGRVLAEASMPAYNGQASACNDMSFTISARNQTPLLAGGRFLRQVGRIIGAHLAVRPPD
jgi:hypothetical protein